MCQLAVFAMLGVLLGYLTADAMSEDFMRILIGAMSLLFGVQYLLGFKPVAGSEHGVVSGGVFGALAGFTSFLGPARLILQEELA
mgnify:CR=1 FL=1